MKCNSCDVPLAPSRKFCHRCRAPVEQPIEITCPNPTCGSRQNSASKSCSECQYEFASASQCTKCGQLVDCDSRYCGECSTENACFTNKNLQDGNSASIDKTDNDDNGNAGSSTDNQPCPGSGNSTDDRKQDIDELDSKPGPEVIPKETDTATTESELPQDTDQYNGSVAKRKNSRKGLAVICAHHTFSVPSKALGVRENAYDDQEIMDKAFEGLDFEVCHYMDMETEFYKKKLYEEINMKMKGKELLVFVLSTHGDESEEGKSTHGKDVQVGTLGDEYTHYFYTKDGQYQTQKLMDNIANLQHMENKLAVYVIQACRSISMKTETQNMDLGIDVIVQSKLTLSSPGFPVDHSDAVGRLPPQSGSIDIEDAKGYMPPPITPPAVQRQLSPAASQNDPVAVESVVTMKEHVQIHVQEVVPVNIPHSDNCVVVFASMSGKYAYSRVNYADDSGGWLIRALSEALEEYKGSEPIHILDVLTKVNQKVSQKEHVLRIDKSNHHILKHTCERSLNVIFENLKVLKNQDRAVAPHFQDWLDDNNETVDSLLEQCEDLIGKLDLHTKKLEKFESIENIKKLEEFIDGQVDSLISKIEKVLDISVKAQSCVFYNIAMDKDRDYYLRYFDN